MTRVKRSLMTKKRHKKILKANKGFRMTRKNVFTKAKNAWMKAGINAYHGRKNKKRDFRKLWTTRINIASRQEGIKYSELINLLYNKKVKLNRKILSNLAISNPQIFSGIVSFAKN